MMRIACAVLLVAALPAQSERRPVGDGDATEAVADPALIADVQRQLSASDLAVVAQGAYAAAEQRLRDAVPALRVALSRLRAQTNEQPTNEQRLCAMAVLDGLVRNGADVPPEEVAPFLRQWHEAALVLLAQRPERSAGVLLEYFAACGRGNERPTIEWLAVGGVLLRARASGFAATVLADLRLDLDVHVHDGAERARGGRFGSSIGCGNRVVPDAFPPIAEYVLTEGRAVGDALLVGDPHPVCWSRLVTRGSHPTTTGHRRTLPQDRIRIDWLEALAAMRAGALELEPSTQIDIVWSDARALLDRVESTRATLEDRWLGLRGELARQKLLARDDPRGATPCVRVTVHDERASADPPLPEIPGAELKKRAR